MRRRAAIAGLFASTATAFSAWGADGVGDAADSTDGQKKLELVIVTAQKHEERLQDVPESITVINPDALELNGQNSITDYFSSVPGLSISNNTYYGGTHYITIRGISAGYNQNPTVATVIDDVPVTSSIVRSAGNLSSPDIDPSDLERIEVLKGPQGTLYGADSLSGLIKYVTVDPSTTKYSGRVEVSDSDILVGGNGYGARGAVNIPVSDTFAFRINAFDRHDPGYINDVSTGQNNFNSENVSGGHIAALWRPSDEFSVKLSALLQESSGNSGLVDTDAQGHPALGEFDYTSLPGTTQFSTRDQLYSANVDWKVGGVELVSVTGYVVNAFKNVSDLTGALGYYAWACELAPNPNSSNYCNPTATPGEVTSLGVPSTYGITTHKISEEIRASSSVGRWIDWRLGGFYTHESSPGGNNGDDEIANLTTGALIGTLYAVRDIDMTFSEHAVFGDITAHIGSQFDIGAGVRQGWSREVEQWVDTGIGTLLIDGAPSPNYVPPASESGSAFTYQVTPRFKISPDLMTYARVASGYRVGGYNVSAVLPSFSSLDIPHSYAPDRTTNYEIGLKYSGFDHKISLDVAAYHIAWRNFQLPVATTNQFVGYTANAGDAKSDGVELSLEAHPLRGLVVSLQGSFNNAVLTQGLPENFASSYVAVNYGTKGTPLPYSLRHSGGVTVDQDLHLTGKLTGFIGGSATYVGSRPFEFIGGTPSATNVRSTDRKSVV